MPHLPESIESLVRKANADGFFLGDISRHAHRSDTNVCGSFNPNLRNQRRLKGGFDAMSDEAGASARPRRREPGMAKR